MTKPEPKYVEATLRWCNARRKEQGKRPLKRMPRGVIFDPYSCPCGKATGLEVYPEVAVLRSRNQDGWLIEENRFSVPKAVERFIRAFDIGRLPQYELKGKK